MNFLGLLLKTSTDFSFYRSVQNSARIRALRFAALLTLLSTVLISAKLTTGFAAAAGEYTQWFGKFFNGMKITNGVLEWQSRIVENFGGKTVMFTINPSKNPKQTYTIPEEASIGVLISKDKITVKKAGNVASEIQEISLEPIAKFEVNPESMRILYIEATAVFGLFCVVAIFTLVFISRMLRAFIMGQLTYFIVFSADKNTLSPLQRQNICLYALGPSTLLEIIGLAFFPGNPYILTLSLGLYLAFVLGAFSYIRRNNEHQQTA